MEPVDNAAEPSGAWPAWATEDVTLTSPSFEYPAHARSYTAELADLLGGVALDEVAHVGSTAVAGLVAKPVVDLTVTVADPPGWCAEHADELTARGWHLVPPELDSIARSAPQLRCAPCRTDSERRLLVRVDPTGARRLAHLHVLWPGSPRRGAFLAFRDALRADPELAEEYARLKQTGAAAHRDDREAYTASKASFVARVLAGPATG